MSEAVRTRRRMAAFVATFVATLLCLAPQTLAAQADTLPQASGRFELWGGFARGSSEWGVLGETPGMNVGLLALRWSRGIGRPRAIGDVPRWEFSFDLIPVARISAPLQSFGSCPSGSICVLPPSPNGDEGFFPDESPFGFGLNLVGLTRRFALSPTVAPTVGATGGFLLFSEPVPTTAGSAFNFTATVELGVRLGRPTGRSLTITYRVLHLSNGGLRPENPAVLSHVVSVGIQRPRAESHRAR